MWVQDVPVFDRGPRPTLPESTTEDRPSLPSAPSQGWVFSFQMQQMLKRE
jgi:hypothetical protein